MKPSYGITLSHLVDETREVGGYVCLALLSLLQEVEIMCTCLILCVPAVGDRVLTVKAFVT